MTELLSFLLVITAGLFFSGLFRKFHIPYVTALILAGVIFGPYGFKFFEITPTIALIGAIGAIFLMFMAGLETHIKHLKDVKRETWVLFSLNSIIPFLTGFAIGLFFKFSLITSFTIGILFISSSVAVLIPQLERTGLLKKRLGKTILTSVIFADVSSLLLLSIFLQLSAPKTAFSLPAYFIIIIIAFLVMKFTFPKIRETYLEYFGKQDTYESQLRFIIVMLIGSAIFFEALGMHSIVAGFIVGMVLSETVKSKKILREIRILSYGLFIPIFFVVVGSEINLRIFLISAEAISITLAIVFGLILSKIISGFIAGKINKFSNKESLIVGIATTPQLSTTIAAAFVAQEFGLLNGTVITSLIALSIITTLFPPLVLNYLTKAPDRI